MDFDLKIVCFFYVRFRLSDEGMIDILKFNLIVVYDISSMDYLLEVELFLLFFRRIFLKLGKFFFSK